MTKRKTNLKPTLRQRLSKFFDANPYEELTVADVALKFNVSPNTAHVVLARMINRTEVQRVTVYRRSSEQ